MYQFHSPYEYHEYDWWGKEKYWYYVDYELDLFPVSFLCFILELIVSFCIFYSNFIGHIHFEFHWPITILEFREYHHSVCFICWWTWMNLTWFEYSVLISRYHDWILFHSLTYSLIPQLDHTHLCCSGCFRYLDNHKQQIIIISGINMWNMFIRYHISLFLFCNLL